MNLQLLITECIQHKRDAQSVLLDEYGPKIMFICKRYANKYIEVDDLFQEAAVRMLEKLHLFDMSRGDFGAWLHRLTVNECINQLRKTVKYEYSDIDDTPIHHHSEEQIMPAIGRDELMALMDQLSDNQRIVFNLYVVEGFKHEEIAEMLNITASTSRSNLSRAKERLKELVVEYNLN